MTEPLISTITCTYQRPHFLRTAIDSLRRQTYRRLEIIIINNGNARTSETVTYLQQLRAVDRRVTVLDYAENHYSFEDGQKMLDLVNNAVQSVVSGDLVFLMNDDEFIADDYLEKMVHLFRDNRECTSAAGLPVRVDAAGRMCEGALERALCQNDRPCYVPGHLMVVDYYLNEKPTMWSASCNVFVLRREEYIGAGGVQRGEHYATFFGVVPFGVSGFDRTAILYNRDHERQLNKIHNRWGNDSGQNVLIALQNLRVEERWRVAFGEELAGRVVSAIKGRTYSMMRLHAEALYQRGQLKAALDQYRRALLVRPDAVGAHLRIGDLCLIDGDVDGARDHYLEALKLGGDGGELHAQLGVALYQGGSLGVAAESLQRAVDLAPGRVDYRRKLAWTLFRQGRVRGAIGQWMEAILLALNESARSALCGAAWRRRWRYQVAVRARKALARVTGGVRRLVGA